MANTVDFLLESKLMLILGIIAAFALKFIGNIKFVDALGAGIMVLLMLYFIVAFLFQGMFNYDG